MDIEPERALTELGERGCGKVPGPGHGFAVEGYGWHTSSVADTAACPARRRAWELAGTGRRGASVSRGSQPRELRHTCPGQSLEARL
ncbi:hypothetical protein GCM10028793_45400 [Nocardiopsis oceani]